MQVDPLSAIAALDLRDALKLVDSESVRASDEKAAYIRGELLSEVWLFDKTLSDFAAEMGVQRDNIRSRKGLPPLEGSTDDQLTEARRSFRLALERNPDVARLHYHLGLLEEEAKDKNAAVQRHEACLTLTPRMPMALYHLGSLYRDAGEDLKAAACYQKLIDGYPDFVDAQTALAELRKREGRLSASADLCVSALTVPRISFNARWRMLSNFVVDEPEVIENDYRGYQISFVYDHYLAVHLRSPDVVHLDAHKNSSVWLARYLRASRKRYIRWVHSNPIIIRLVHPVLRIPFRIARLLLRGFKQLFGGANPLMRRPIVAKSLDELKKRLLVLRQ